MVQKGIKKNEKQGQMYVLSNSKGFIKMHTPRLFFFSVLFSSCLNLHCLLSLLGQLNERGPGRKGNDQTVPQNGGRYQ